MNIQAQRRSDTKEELRKEAGAWLRELRERRRLSQRQLAAQLGYDYYTIVSQLETGRGRVPPDRYEAWAEALGAPPLEFVRTLLRYYDPETYRILFGRHLGHDASRNEMP